MDIDFSNNTCFPPVYYAEMSDGVETALEEVKENVEWTSECYDDSEELELELNEKRLYQSGKLYQQEDCSF